MNHYERLGINASCDFKELKKAYYKKVKECHPDLFNNSRAKEEEFKQLVNAFDILSDPESRAKYDSSIGVTEAEEIIPEADFSVNLGSIMDSAADDVLEELVVGNKPPENTSLATLLTDLENTQLFIMFREAKTLYFHKEFREAIGLFLTAISCSPSNIIYRVYLARAYASTGSYGKAASQYLAALNIGERRVPPQHMINIKKELAALRDKRLPLWTRFLMLFKDKPHDNIAYDAETMIGETNRSIAKIMSEKKEKKRIEETKKLPPSE